jgi:hypothetical protein
MGFAGKHDVASDNYTYMLFCAVRLGLTPEKSTGLKAWPSLRVRCSTGLNPINWNFLGLVRIGQILSSYVGIPRQ